MFRMSVSSLSKNACIRDEGFLGNVRHRCSGCSNGLCPVYCFRYSKKRGELLFSLFCDIVYTVRVFSYLFIERQSYARPSEKRAHPDYPEA